MGLWAAASDYGVLPKNDAGRLRNEIFPGRQKVTREAVASWCGELEGEGLLIPFEAEDKEWWVLKGFEKRQPMRRKSPCGRPLPHNDASVGQCRTMSGLNVERRTLNVEQETRNVEREDSEIPEFAQALKGDFPDINIRLEWAKCQDYWLQKKKKEPSKRAFINWLQNETRYAAERPQNGQQPQRTPTFEEAFGDLHRE